MADGTQTLIIFLKKLVRLKHSAKQIKGNETFITEQINLNTSWITTGKFKEKSGIRRKQNSVVVVAVSLHIWLSWL